MVACGHDAPAAPAHASKSPEEAAARAFIDDLARAAGPERAQREWAATEERAGRFFECRDAKLETTPEGSVVALDCVFQRTEKTIRVTLDERRTVTGVSYVRSNDLLGKRVRSLVEKSSDGDFTTASAHFGSAMRTGLPPDKLAVAWRELVARAGRFQSIEDIKFAPSAGGKTHESVAIARFEKSKIQVKVVWDDRDEIVGLFFAPDQPWTPAPYARPDAVVVTDITVGTSPALPGNLTLPKGDIKVPAVVLIHGSGPGNRDEAIGGIRVFADLADGLSARGFGVLRYDKRSRVAPAGIVTEKDEVLDAAEQAIELLRRHPRVDARRIFVIGHSQGGNLAPRIVAKATDIAGYVTLAGPTRPFQDVVLDQYEYFSKLDPGNSQLEESVAAAREFKRRLDDPALKPDDDPKAPFGGHAKGAYYLFQRGYDPVATARSLAIPILVLQGGRDYQVTAKDYARWKAGLESAPFATLKWFPEDNHLFVSGEGKPTAAEYDALAHVDPRVIETIAEWAAKIPAR